MSSLHLSRSSGLHRVGSTFDKWPSGLEAVDVLADVVHHGSLSRTCDASINRVDHPFTPVRRPVKEQ
jgi:hypothetical protein